MTEKSAAKHRRVCAWCTPPRPIDDLGPILPGEIVTHSMCTACARRTREELELLVPDAEDDPEAVERGQLEEFLARTPPFQRAPESDPVHPSAAGAEHRILGLLLFVAALTLAIAAFTAGMVWSR